MNTVGYTAQNSESLRSFRLLLVDDDPVFRLGLRVCLEQVPDLTVLADVATATAALTLLAQSDPETEPPAAIAESAEPPTAPVDLVILDLALEAPEPSDPELSGLELCQRLKTEYPHLPILLLSAPPESSVLAAAQEAGVEGYCPKGTAIASLLQVIRQILEGQTVWLIPDSGTELPVSQPGSLVTRPEASTALAPPPESPWTLVRRNWRMSGLQQIDAALDEVTAQLRNAQLSALDRAILVGRWRELRTARWLVSRLLATPEALPAPPPTPPRPVTPAAPRRDRGTERLERRTPPSASAPPADLLEVRPESSPDRRSRSLQAALWDATVQKLEGGLQNLMQTPLEIDILQEEKKRELLYIILRQLENILDELRFSQVQLSQLPDKQVLILQDLWQSTLINFFGKYYTLPLSANREIEVVSVLLQDAAIIQKSMLNRIPQVLELLAHLLFQTPLTIDNATYGAGSPEAMERAEALLQNLLIQVANAVIQPLLNYFADVEVIKQNFYDRRLLSTREIERFRNDLSWKYRLEQYVGEPQAIFESQYRLLVLAGYGIRKVAIYAPRGEELAQLSGIPLAVTLALETRDAIAPRLRAAIAFVGSGLVYILTEVIGRGIGLIGRGILKGVGSAWQEGKFNKK